MLGARGVIWRIRNLPAWGTVVDVVSHWLAATHQGSGLLVNRNIKASTSASAAFLALWFGNAPNAAAQSTPSEPLHVAIEALADQQSIEPGQTFLVALVERIQPGWHTYWVNPGDAGQATRLRWTLPSGYRVDEVQWPVPQVFRSGPLVTYGYEGEVVLLQKVHSPDRLSSAPAKLSVEAQWLACQDICIPEHGASQVTVRQEPIAGHHAPAASTALFTAAGERLPKPCPWSTSLVVRGASVVLTVHGIARKLPAAAKVQFLPLIWGEIDNAAKQRTVRSGADLLLTLARGDLRSAPLGGLDGVLVLGPGSGQLQGQGFLLHALASGTDAPRAS
jgi:thiol:disulfide interchange protein DsbD